MEQRPEPGLEPYEPPTAAVAQAYLDESARVAQRREQHIDRRAAARLLLAEGITFAIYLIVLMLVFPPAEGVNIIVIVAPFIVWTQLVTMLREEYGYQRRGREQRMRTAVMLILLAVVIGSLGTLMLGVDIPVALRFAPGVLCFVLYGLLAWGEWRHATAERIVRKRAPFDRGARLTTACIGIAVGAIVACVATPSALIANVVNLLAMLALVVWLSASMLTRGSQVALAWGPFLWSCLALSGAVIVALLLLAQFTSVPLTIWGYVAGGAIALAFVLGAWWGPDRG